MILGVKKNVYTYFFRSLNLESLYGSYQEAN